MNIRMIVFGTEIHVCIFFLIFIFKYPVGLHDSCCIIYLFKLGSVMFSQKWPRSVRNYFVVSNTRCSLLFDLKGMTFLALSSITSWLELKGIVSFSAVFRKESSSTSAMLLLAEAESWNLFNYAMSRAGRSWPMGAQLLEALNSWTNPT